MFDSRSPLLYPSIHDLIVVRLQLPTEHLVVSVLALEAIDEPRTLV